MSVKDKTITVLGGGIAGLAVARALSMRGAEVTVLEQADALREVGAGIQITPNGVRVLDALGLGETLRQNGLRSQAVELRNHNGRKVLRMPLQGADYFFVHRADLIDLLADGARDSGVEIQLQKQIVDVKLSSSGAALTTGQGADINTNLLIGADGINSKTREALNGRAVPFFTRQVAWRATVPALGNEPEQATIWMGPKRHLVTYPLREGRLINIVAVEERGRWADEGWNVTDDPKALSAAFADFAPEVVQLLSRVENVHLWGLFRHSVAPKWYNECAALLGDAAHPTLPFLAQGANLALEDAWVLAAKLDQLGLQNGLSAYQKTRADRVSNVIAAANKNARNYHFSAPLSFMAHNILRLTGAIAPNAMLRRFDWIYNYDATGV